MSERGDSRLGKNRLGPRPVDPVDGPGPDESPIVEDLVLGSAGGGPSRTADGLPGDLDGFTVDGSSTVEDGPGDDPLDVDVLGVRPPGDGDSAGVLGSVRVDPIDDVGAGDAGPLAQLGSGETGTEADDGDGEGEDPGSHSGESKKGIPRSVKALIAVVGLLVAGVMAFAVFEPVQVLPRIRLGPGFSFVDQAGEFYTSEDGRGVVTLYSFAPTTCGDECDAMYDTMSEVGERVRSDVDLGEADFRQVTVALDTSDPGELAAAAEASGADGSTWLWVGADEPHRKDVVGGGFRVFYDSSGGDTEFDPVFVIVDGSGLIRGEYRYATLAADADRLTRHIGLLGEEIRNANGNAALVYEAAHVFLCYP